MRRWVEITWGISDKPSWTSWIRPVRATLVRLCGAGRQKATSLTQ